MEDAARAQISRSMLQSGHLRNLVGADALRAIATAGGKTVYVNQICRSAR
jgi:hypothetical protein